MNKTDYLRFSAYSIKDLITRKLSEDTKFTDQIYEGSNLAILIDLVSYMYQCLMFQLNNAASESMFSDTQIYENISRMVNLIGYHPKGLTPSKATFYLENDVYEESKANIFIPKYSYVDTKLVDKHGKRIYYSLTEKNGFKTTNDEVQEFQLTNGKWTLYPQRFTSSGSFFEEFQTTIGSNVNSTKLCANNMIDVYVGEYDTNTNTWKYKQWEKTGYEIFTNNNTEDILNYANIYDNKSEIYGLKLDENKNYVIKFGDGIVGKKLKKGDKICIFYLDTNGLDGEISIDTVPTAIELKLPEQYSLTSEEYFQIILEGKERGSQDLLNDINNKIELNLIEQSTKPKAEEGVSEIKENAPNWFKMGQRLVTADDYTYFMKNLIPTSIVDCKVQNNFEYCASFYKWLYDLGLNGNNVQKQLRESNGRYYIDESRMVKYDYKFADPADANNVYIWTKMENGTIDSIKDYIIENLYKVKMITQEVVLLNPINVQFAITAAPLDVVYNYISDGTEFDPNGDSYIEITLDDNTIYATTIIQNEIENIIIEFFSSQNNKLGTNIEYQNLLNKIYSISGIQRIRTIYNPGTTNQNIIIRDGLSFASWSGSYIDTCDDLEVSNTTRSLLDFQFPSLYTKDISRRIKIIRKSINNINQIKY